MPLHLVDEQVLITPRPIHRHWNFPGGYSHNATFVSAKAHFQNLMQIVVAMNATGTDPVSDETATFAAAQCGHEDSPVNNDYSLAAEYNSCLSLQDSCPSTLHGRLRLSTHHVHSMYETLTSCVRHRR